MFAFYILRLQNVISDFLPFSHNGFQSPYSVIVYRKLNSAELYTSHFQEHLHYHGSTIFNNPAAAAAVAVSG
jgi:hypothetical protein